MNPIQQQLYRKIIDCINIKIKYYYDLQRTSTDVIILKFYEAVSDFKSNIEEIKAFEFNFEGYTEQIVLDSIKQLCQSKNRSIEDLVKLRKTVVNQSRNSCYKIALDRLDRATDTLQEHFNYYIEEIEYKIKNLYDIYQVYDIQYRLRFLYSNHRAAKRNLINQKHIITEQNAKFFLIGNLKNLEDSVQTHFQQVIKMTTNLGISDEQLLTSAATIRESVAMEEVQELRQEMFKDTELSLAQQKEHVETKVEVKKEELGSHIKEIGQLEVNMEQLQQAVEKLMAEQEQAKQELQLRRKKLREGLRELARLQKLIQAIDADISSRIQLYQQEIEDLENKRIQITNDPNLTAEEKQKLLQDVKQEMNELKRQHTSILSILHDQKLELVKSAKEQAAKLGAVKEDLLKRHLDEVKELEQRMINASPSELLELQVEVERLQGEFQENMDMVEQFKARPLYMKDEHGRYFIDADGRKIYKQSSVASEHILGEDGEWIKIKDGVELSKDEKGDYYLDDFGKKVYTRKYFHDQFGRYFIDSEGRRVYKANDGAAEYVLIDGQLRRVRDSDVKVSVNILTDENGAYYFDAAENKIYIGKPADEENDLASGKSGETPETQENFRYIKAAVGKPLVQGLASLVLHQPQDPINYLANFLLHYQNNQERYAAREQELQELLAERELVQMEEQKLATIGKICGIEAKNSVLK